MGAPGALINLCSSLIDIWRLENPAGTRYTIGMKVAVSIPDPVFEEAERLAKRLKASRSEIYARALAAFVGTHSPDRVTQAMNAVVDSVGPDPNGFVNEAARRTLDGAEW